MSNRLSGCSCHEWVDFPFGLLQRKNWPLFAKRGQSQFSATGLSADYEFLARALRALLVVPSKHSGPLKPERRQRDRGNRTYSSSSSSSAWPETTLDTALDSSPPDRLVSRVSPQEAPST